MRIINKWPGIAGPYLKAVVAACLLTLPAQHLFAQSDLKPWGNLNGIRIKGQLMEFSTDLDVVGKDWKKISATAKEVQRPKYIRDGNRQIVNTALGGFKVTETVVDEGTGAVSVTVNFVAQQDTVIRGLYFGVSLPKAAYTGSVVKLDFKIVQLNQLKVNADGEYLHQVAKGISFKTLRQSFSIGTDTAGLIIMRPDTVKIRGAYQVYLPVCSGKITKGAVFQKTYHISVSGIIDSSPVTIKLNPAVVGRPFAGFGGNFRLQNPADPQVIDYCLKNMRVAFGRVEMPWRNWQPAIDKDPTAAADSGKLDKHVAQSMEIAQRLGKMGMPVIVTAWAPPAWAVVGRPRYGKSPEGIWGNPIDHTKEPQIYKSIADYIVYLRDHYGVEASYFSFNESDLGINIRQTGEEHDALIKGLGAYFESRGLKTKLLLGDNSDATTYKFIYPAMNDPEARKYMGAVSFHSWRGWDTGTLQKWADAAKKLNLPLLVGEGSIDAAGYAYPTYFQEQGYALEEINLYIRLLSICQPLSILQWQLTSDYSPLTGGGVYGDNSPIKPTWRFWNLKQLASTPEHVNYLACTANKKEISVAALGNKAKGVYTIHIVNNGTSRRAYLTGLPATIKGFTMYVTDSQNNMAKLNYIKVTAGKASFNLRATGFTSLVNE